jgi:hypothetical protein
MNILNRQLDLISNVDPEFIQAWAGNHPYYGQLLG